METAPHLFNRLRQSKPFFLFVGTNVVESTERCLRLADTIAKVAEKHDGRIAVAFKASWDKANRTSPGAYRGVGMEEGLLALEAVKAATGLPIVTDAHETNQVDAIAQVADIIQIPSFLCRQTDLLEAAGRSGRIVHIKKGQFANLPMMRGAVDKVRQTGNPHVMVCERGASWGPSHLVFDPRQLLWMRQLGCPVVADVTHSCQHPVDNSHGESNGSFGSGNGSIGGGGNPARSRGSRGEVAAVARASVAVGVDGLFLECHDDLERAPVDGNLQWPIDRLEALIDELVAIGEITQGKTTDYVS